MATVAQGVIASCPVFMPALTEQEAILGYIESECERVASAIDRTRGEISLLREYRTRLIADVVTGKLDVREAAAALPEEPDGPEPPDEADHPMDEDATVADGLDTASEEVEA